MNCCNRSERARHFVQELTLILYWGFYFGDTMTAEDRKAQDFRRKQLIRELLDIRHQCAGHGRTAEISPCHVQLFFGECAGKPEGNTGARCA